MLAFTAFSSGLIVQPLTPAPTRSCAITPPLVTASLLEKTRLGSSITEVQPGARYREAQQPSSYYAGRNPANSAALKQAMKDIGKRKLLIITGASSGLGLYCFEALSKEDYYILAAVRDPAKSVLDEGSNRRLACRRWSRRRAPRRAAARPWASPSSSRA